VSRKYIRKTDAAVDGIAVEDDGEGAS